MHRNDIIKTYLKAGDVITHTRCMGCVEEHVFTGYDGIALCGFPTRDTMRIEKKEGRARDFQTNDIHPNNLTHINRVPINVIPLLAENQNTDATPAPTQ